MFIGVVSTHRGLSCCFCKGAETTAKLTKMKVLIYGLRGVGVETAKNLALQGAGAMTVSIPQKVWRDKLF